MASLKDTQTVWCRDDGGLARNRTETDTIETNEQNTETNPQAAISGFETLDSAGVLAVIGPSSSECRI